MNWALGIIPHAPPAREEPPPRFEIGKAIIIDMSGFVWTEEAWDAQVERIKKDVGR